MNARGCRRSLRGWILPWMVAALLAWGLSVHGAVEPPPAGGDDRLVLAGGMVDVVSGQLLPEVAVRVQEGRILQVGSRDAMEPPPGAEVLDLGDLILVPGLVDAHTHVALTPDYSSRNPILFKSVATRTLEAAAAARANLLAGFTTLRDVDNEGADQADVALRDAVAAGLVPGPRMQVAGWALSITAGHMNQAGLPPAIDAAVPQFAILADDLPAMVAGVRSQVKAGVDWIKIYATGTLRHIDPETLEPVSQLSEAEVRALVEEARRWGKPVAAHAYGGSGALNAVRGGVRSIEHGMFLDGPTLSEMASRGTVWVPTLMVYFPEPGDADAALRQRIVSAHRDTFRRALRAGVRIAFGSDAGAVPHGTQARELGVMVDYGMTPLQALRSATVVAAELMGLEDRVGRIAPGYAADLVGVPGNPLEGISSLERVRFVMRGGEVARRP